MSGWDGASNTQLTHAMVASSCKARPIFWCHVPQLQSNQFLPPSTSKRHQLGHGKDVFQQHVVQSLYSKISAEASNTSLPNYIQSGNGQEAAPQIQMLYILPNTQIRKTIESFCEVGRSAHTDLRSSLWNIYCSINSTQISADAPLFINNETSSKDSTVFLMSTRVSRCMHYQDNLVVQRESLLIYWLLNAPACLKHD